MIWTNYENNKFIYMLKLDILGHPDIFYADKYQGMDLELSKTNKAVTVSVNTIESFATITTNTQKGLLYFPYIDVQYTNEITKQFAFISESTTFKNKKALITNDKQLMMRIIKQIINKKITRVEQFGNAIEQNSALAYTHTVLYNNTVETLYQIYKTLNDKIKPF